MGPELCLQSVRETLTEYMQMETSVIDADWVASVIDRAKKKPIKSEKLVFLEPRLIYKFEQILMA
ncbi:MAG: hypothetical protein CM1200mP15_18930 [Dehalococcoidia bacterium]|nr:MAG: hypothetical protein CM1200mP15_18930 [Dehalococcoidia bacterium]